MVEYCPLIIAMLPTERCADALNRAAKDGWGLAASHMCTHGPANEPALYCIMWRSVPDPAEACPICGSTSTTICTVDGVKRGECINCGKIWDVEDEP